MQNIPMIFGARRHRLDLSVLAFGLVLLLAACGGDSSSDESTDATAGDESAQAGDDVGVLLAQSATVTRCEIDPDGGFPAMDVELTNPLAEQSQNIFVYIDVLDSSGEVLDSATAVFENLAPGATATALTGAFSFPEDAELGSCVPTGGATS